MKKKLVPLIGIGLCVLVFVSNLLTTRAHEQVAGTPAQKNDIKISSALAESRDDVLNRCAEEFIASFPDHSKAEYDPDTKLFLLYFWGDDMDNVARQAMAGEEASLSSWGEILSGLAELSAAVQHECDAAGYDDISVGVHFLNPSNLKNSLATASRGVVIYDVVSDSSAESVPVRYIVNISSSVFHLPDCPHAQNLSDGNRAVFTGDRADLIAQGYRPCGSCNP